jgi:hypothetical protein
MPAHQTILAPEGYESLANAARRYRVSERTLRRRIEDGELEAERVTRPQGSVLFVKLPPDAAPPDGQAAPGGDAASDQTRTIGGTSGGATGQDAATIVTIMAPLLAELTESRREVADLREDRGRLQAERDAASARAVELRAERDEARAELKALRALPWWRRLFG